MGSIDLSGGGRGVCFAGNRTCGLGYVVLSLLPLVLVRGGACMFIFNGKIFDRAKAMGNCGGCDAAFAPPVFF